MGISLSSDELARVYQKFIELADKKKVIYDDDLMLIASEEMTDAPVMYRLEYMHVATGTSTVPTATVRLRKGDEVVEDAACGDGPVDAALRTIDRLTGVQGRLLDFSLQAVTIGKDAMGEVSLRVAFGGDTLSAKAASTDIVEAGAKAYLSCVNRHVSAQTTNGITQTRAARARRKTAKRPAAKKRAAVPRKTKKKA
jgi:2-isopropylmalate synthase